MMPTRRSLSSALSRGAALITGLLGLAACETVLSGANPEVPAWTHRPAGVLNLSYTRKIVAPMRHRGEPYQQGQVELDIRGKRLFVGSSDHGLYALQAVDGEPLWRFQTAGPVQSAPLYDPATDTLYFGSNDGALYRVDAETGRMRWRFATNAEVSQRPVLARDVLYFANANDSVLAVDAEKGTQRWVQHRAPALGMEIAGHSGVTLWRDKIYAGFSDGTIAAFEALTGEEYWQPVDLAAEAETTLGDVPDYLDLDTTPATGIIDGTPALFVGAYAAGVYALDAETGAHLWSNTEIRGTTRVLLWRQPAHRERGADTMLPERYLLIVATGTSGLWALDARTGEEVWRQKLPAGGVTAPVPFAGALLVSTSQLGLFLVSPLDGSVIDGLHMTTGSASVPAVHGQRAFVVTNGGQLLALDLQRPLSGSADKPWPRQLF